MKIEILGPGCANCQTLAKNAKQAVEELGINADIVKVTELGKIMAMGVMSPPAIAIDGEIKSTGRLLSVEEIKDIIS
jgi:small redox-active disulfide protein 2